jgi:hypothetical protein
MSDALAGAETMVKKVPKWAWIAGAGITGGILFYRYKQGGNAVTTTPSGDLTAPGDTGQTYSPLGTVSATPTTDSGAYPVTNQGLTAGDVGDLFSVFQASQPPPTSPVDLINSVLPYIGGGAPSSEATQAPVAAPAVAPTPPPPPKPAAAPKPACSGEFPFQGPGGCYKVVCASGKGDAAKGRWHYYKNGSKQHVSNTC